MSLFAFTNQLARNMTKRLSRAIADGNTSEITKLKKSLDNPQKIHEDVKKIQEKYNNGEDLDVIDREIDESLVSGPEVAKRLQDMGNDDPELKNQENSGFSPATLEEIYNHDTYKKEIVDIDDLLFESPSLKEHVSGSKSKIVKEDKINKPATVEPVVDKNGDVKDGFNRLHQVKIDKDNGVSDGKVTILRGTSILKDNADGEVIKRISMFGSNLKAKIKDDVTLKGKKGKRDDKGVLLKKGIVNEAKMKEMEFKKESTSFARILEKATNNRDPEIYNDDLLVGFAFDVLRAAKANRGGKPGRKLTQISDDGTTSVTTAKNMNELSKEIGEAASSRILNSGGSSLIGDEKIILGRMLLEFGRGNFAGNPSDSALSLNGYSLLKETQKFKDVGKGSVREQAIITTSPEFDFWVQGNGAINAKGLYETGHGGRSWMNLYPEHRSLKAASINHHGDYKIGPDGKVQKAPRGVDVVEFIGGGKGLTSETINSAEVLNYLGNQKLGVDPLKFEYWQHLGERGVLKDTGLDKEALESAVHKTKLSEETEKYLYSYFARLEGLKQDFNNLEDAARLKENKPKLTPTERQNFQSGKHLRKTISDLYYFKPKRSKTNDGSPTGAKIDLDNSIGPYAAENDNFLKALMMVNKESSNIPLLNVSKRARFKKIKAEINLRFREDPTSEFSNGAEMYMPYMIDSRGRIYPIDSSGANLLTGGSARFNYSVPKSFAKPVAYNDEAFHSIVDDFLRFEDNPLSGNKSIGKGASDDLNRWKYWLLNKDAYLKRGNDLLEASENSLVAKNKIERDKLWDSWKNKNKWLKDIKDQGPYLSNLIEIAKIKRAHDKGEVYNTSQLVELDASASGSQHIGAQYGDVETLWSTNVYSQRYGKARKFLSKEEIQMLNEGVDSSAAARDLYTDVKVVYKKAFDKNLETLSRTNPEKAQIYRELTEKYIQVGRSTTKPIVMKVPYGAGMLRLKKSMEALLKGEDRLKIMNDYKGRVDDSTSLHKEFMDFHWGSMEEALRKGLDTQYEFKRFNDVIGKIYIEAAGTIDMPRRPFVINSPSGGKTDLTMYAMQNYRTYEKVRVDFLPNFEQTREKVGRLIKTGPNAGQPETKIGSAKLNTDLRIPMSPGDPDAALLSIGNNRGIGLDNLDDFAVNGMMPQEAPFSGRSNTTMATALSPNVTHSIDAAYLNNLVLALKEAGIPVYVVHDAFFVLPTDIKNTKAIAGKVFTDMHSGYNLREEMIQGLADSTGMSYDDILNKVDDMMINPSDQEINRGIKDYPDGALRMKSEGKIGSPENKMSYAPEGVKIDGPEDVVTSNVIIGG